MTVVRSRRGGGRVTEIEAADVRRKSRMFLQKTRDAFRGTGVNRQVVLLVAPGEEVPPAWYLGIRSLKSQTAVGNSFLTSRWMASPCSVRSLGRSQGSP